MQQPSIGRIVHYVFTDPDKGFLCRAAIITEVSGDESVGLSVHFPHGVAFYNDVPFNDGRISEDGTWHWPERI